MTNYFNSLSKAEKLDQLGTCRFMELDEFSNEADALKDKKIVIVGCGAQGLNQGLNMRDSGLDISYALRESSPGMQLGIIFRPVPHHPATKLSGNNIIHMLLKQRSHVFL